MIRSELDNRMTTNYIINHFGNILNEKQLYVVKMYYSDSPKTFSFMSKELNLSQQRIPQILATSTRKLNEAVAKYFRSLPIPTKQNRMIDIEENLMMRKILIDILN